MQSPIAYSPPEMNNSSSTIPAMVGRSNEWCNHTLYLSVYNLTSSYTDKRNEATIVTTSAVMFILAAIFFNLNLYSRFTQVSAILNPTVRIFLSASLSLFLPVMSYLFSEAKNDGADTELSQRARTILMWMLLVELLRKKVEAIGVQAYSGTIERAARIGWLGYLVFFNLRSAGKKALYATLWVLAAGKLVQRFVTMELAKRSLAYGRNPQLLACYMAQALPTTHDEAEQQQLSLSGRQLLKQCKYIVMGELDLEKTAGPDGYVFPAGIENRETRVVTVGEIWEIAEDDELFRDKDGPALTRLCLSFALYKLLRRRLEDFPVTDKEARNCHDLVFKGLLPAEEEAGSGSAAAAALFQVFNDEVQFLCEYYHSVHPVVLASPFFFLVNYILFPMVVWALCILTIILCSNGDVSYAFHSFNDDNYVVAVGIVKIAICIMLNIRESRSPMALYSTVDISITILLFLAFVYEQIWEFIVFLLSNWFLVSLLCSYTRSRRWRQSQLTRRAIRCILWVRSKLSYPNICFKQFSVLWFWRWPSSWLPTVAVPEEAKRSIVERLAKNADRVVPRSNGTLALQSNPLPEPDDLSWACAGGLAEVIVTWHIATALLEARHPGKEQLQGAGLRSRRKVATALSRYCTYLVAFRPELLPDDMGGTARVYEETKEELKKEMRCWGYYLSGKGARCDKLMEIARRAPAPAPEGATALCRGARLGKALIEQHERAADDDARERVWKLVADVWTEVVVCAAPTGSEVHVKAHKEALAHGMEFITVLWAMATHTGISRAPVPATTPAPAPAMSTTFRSISIEHV